MYDLFITFTFRGELKKVFLNDINFIKHKGRKIQVHTIGFTSEYYGCVRDMAAWLDYRFYTSHSRLIVNLANIDAFLEKSIRFLSGDSVPIGVNNLRLTKHKYQDYLRRRAYEIMNRKYK